LLGVSFLAILVAIVVVQEGARRIPVQAAKRQVGGRLYQGRMSYIPFKINQGGVMPIIFASSLMLFPLTVSSWIGGAKPKLVPIDWQIWTPAFWGWENIKNALVAALNTGFAAITTSGFLYNALFFLLIIFFTYFYASLVLNPAELANNLKKYGNFIPGYRPGKPTADFLEAVLNRITFMGAMFLGAVAILPDLVGRSTGIQTFQGLGGTALLIMVGVAIDLYNQLQTHLLARQYEGFMK
jgi:preprotein translocase subunit SecY